jgi:hypothetical protein
MVLLLAFAALGGLAGAAGQSVEQGGTQATAPAIAQSTSDNDSLYDYRSVSEGGSYYAPGSYASWYYVAPPAIEVASTEPETPATEYRAPPTDLHKYYDYDRYFGPLFG